MLAGEMAGRSAQVIFPRQFNDKPIVNKVCALMMHLLINISIHLIISCVDLVVPETGRRI